MHARTDDAGSVVVAIDAQLIEPPFHVADAFVVELHDGPGLVTPDALEEQLVLQPLPSGEVTGVTATGAETGELLLQHHHLGAQRSKFKGRGETGKARPNHDHIGTDIPFQLGLQVIGALQPAT